MGLQQRPMRSWLHYLRITVKRTLVPLMPGVAGLLIVMLSIGYAAARPQAAATCRASEGTASSDADVTIGGGNENQGFSQTDEQARLGELRINLLVRSVAVGCCSLAVYFVFLYFQVFLGHAWLRLLYCLVTGFAWFGVLALHLFWVTMATDALGTQALFCLNQVVNPVEFVSWSGSVLPRLPLGLAIAIDGSVAVSLMVLAARFGRHLYVREWQGAAQLEVASQERRAAS